MSSDKKSPRKKFISELTDDDLYSDADDAPQKISEPSQKNSSTVDVDDVPQKISEPSQKNSSTVDVDDADKKISEPRRKTFHSKNFAHEVDEDSDAEKKSEPRRKISHAEASGIVISVVMVVYSLVTEDKPLFFLATALLIFLLRPLIGGLFGEHNQAVQNALHGFSIALFVGAILFLFM